MQTPKTLAQWRTLYYEQKQRDDLAKERLKELRARGQDTSLAETEQNEAQTLWKWADQKQYSAQTELRHLQYRERCLIVSIPEGTADPEMLEFIRGEIADLKAAMLEAEAVDKAHTPATVAGKRRQFKRIAPRY